ncbi:MAG: hypothetical protein JWO06_2160, partial [Bacteroidota bacterium]|nr:hypothetical protein [Bacteroidota bacterium]
MFNAKQILSADVGRLLMRFLQTKILFGLLAISSFSLLNAQTSTTERFGQNRVQYKDFIFQYYESDNFITHFYQGGQDVAKYVIKTAEDNSEEIAKMLDFRYKKKIDIIVYNSITELNQTNIGIYEEGQNPGGTIKIPDNKIFIYFNGDHRNLDKQIREGIAKIYVDKMVRGTGFAEMIQNAVLLNLPDWYRLGLIQYIGEPWNSEMEDHLRDGILSGRYKKLNKLKPEEAVFVGNSIWHYLEEVHGKTAVNNIMYLTRINRSVDNGFLFVLGTNLQQTLQDWYNYYYQRFSNEAKASSLPPDNTIVKARIKKIRTYYEPKLSPDGKYIAYASNDMGRYRVHLLNTETGKTKVLLRGGFRTNTQFTDESIPLIAWSPDGKKLGMIKDWRSQISITYYEPETGKKVVNPIRKFQKVVSFNFVDSKQLVMSAMQNGQSDIFLYNIASTTTRKLTDDYFDDLYPAYVVADSIRGIMFSSNREEDTTHPKRYESQLIDKHLDLFFYDLDANNNVLYRVTSTPNANETYPQNLNEHEFCFLSDANGVRNRYTGHFDRVFDHNQKTYRFTVKETDEEDSVQIRAEVPLDSVIDRSTITLEDSSFEKVYKTGGITGVYTNYTHGILAQSVVPGKGLALDMFKLNNKIQFRKYSVESTASQGKAPTTEYMLQLERKEVNPKTENPSEPKKENQTGVQKKDSTTANRGNRPYDFQNEFDYGVKLFDWDSASASRIAAGNGGYVFRFSRVRPYFVRFSVDKVIAQVDNNPIITRYQPFDPASPQYNVNSLGALIKFGVTDLLEDNKLYGGFRLPFAGISGNNEYFLTYESLKKRLDKKFTFYRSSQSGTAYTTLPFTTRVLPDGSQVDYSIKTNYLEAQLSYPLDVLNSLRFTFGFRNDRVVYKSEDTLSLNLPSLSDNWLSARAEYVFDNCLEVMTNIRYGLRFKVFTEVQKEFPTVSKQISAQVDLPVPKFNDKVLGIVGFDLRYYLKIYKSIIWANRASGAISFGTAKMIYYLGGLDNWITSPTFSKFDNTTPINVNNNYAFQTLATPLRGYKQNARNGNKYLLINSELRVPIFSAFINSNIKSEFIKNFQLIGFFDAGTAWEGLSPFSSNNPLFNQSYPNPIDNPSVIV